MLAKLLGALTIAGSCAIADCARAAGALAIGSCGAYGYTYDFPNIPTASAGALGNCTGDCKVVATVRRACAAYAVDGNDACKAFGFSVASSRAQAQRIALRYCADYGGQNCIVRAWVCDGSG